MPVRCRSLLSQRTADTVRWTSRGCAFDEEAIE